MNISAITCSDQAMENGSARLQHLIAAGLSVLLMLGLGACSSDSGSTTEVTIPDEGGEDPDENSGPEIPNPETDPEGQPDPPTGNSQSVITFGDIQTYEIGGVVFSSLPEAQVNTSAASVELGRLLFWDPILSGDMDIACATCHLPEFGYSDGRARSAGTSGQGTGPARVPGEIGEVPRNAQTVLNTIWNGINELGVFDPATAPMFRDNRTQSLANQALDPIRSREEMRGDNFTEAEIDAAVITRLSGISEYQVLFSDVFGENSITMTNIGNALADYQSTLIANNSPFDRWMRGDTNAMTQQQFNGMNLFADTGCADCHSGPMFSNYELQVLGVAEADGLTEPDTGNGSFAFRTPTLRQLAFTGPYFHGGQDSDLNDVIDFYDNPESSENPNVPTDQLDPDFLIMPVINDSRRNAIRAFLDALNDDSFDRTRPDSVPSGLPVGGAL